MKTIVYISRYSEPFRNLLGEYNAPELFKFTSEDSSLINIENID